MTHPSSARSYFFTWIFLCVAVGLLIIAYVSTGWRASGGNTLAMPLDDAYIHFQYARQLADGQPFHYISGDPATSGGTSLLYPALLAIGYRIGFQGDHLAWWAIAIGALAWIGSAWLICRLVTLDLIPNQRLPIWIGVLIALAFALCGSLDWAFMSGMETGLAVFVILLTIWFCARDQFRPAIIAACVIAILRPEGAIIAGGVAIWFILKRRRKAIPLALLPIIVIVVQPLLNLIATGSITASGLQAKSYLYGVPFDLKVIISTVWTVFVHIWTELLSGVSTDHVYYGTSLVFVLAAIALIALLINGIRQRRPEYALILLGLIGFGGMIAQLQTAAWQFKRYQQPIIALLFVLAGWSIPILLTLIPKNIKSARKNLIGGLIGLALIAFSLSAWPRFLIDYYDNIHEVATLQSAVTQYVTATLPPDARVGVHDIGIMAYLGNVKTYDVVGLSTPGAALAWRNGPGAIYEQLRNSPMRPDYFAIYPDASGLGYFTATDMFRDVLMRFSSTHPAHDVASVGDEIVTRPDWSKAAFADRLWQPFTLNAIKGFTLVDSINVGDLQNEAAHSYEWHQSGAAPGFPTELYQMNNLDCQSTAENPACTVIDGGRLLNGGEDMTITIQPGRDLLWITRVHPHDSSTLSLSVNGQPFAQRVIPGGYGGSWLEVATLIPAAKITSDHTRLSITVLSTSGAYMPYYHWFYQGTYTNAALSPIAGRSAHFENGANLIDWQIVWNPATRTWQITVTWQADPRGARGIDKVFVHLINESGAIVAQMDEIPVHNTLSPGDWLPGAFTDTYTLSAPPGNGVYQIAVGLYDPTTTIAVPVTGGDPAGRVFLGTVTPDF